MDRLREHKRAQKYNDTLDLVLSILTMMSGAFSGACIGQAFLSIPGRPEMIPWAIGGLAVFVPLFSYRLWLLKR